MQPLDLTRHISRVQEPHETNGQCRGQCGHRTFPSSQKVLSGSAAEAPLEVGWEGQCGLNTHWHWVLQNTGNHW